MLESNVNESSNQENNSESESLFNSFINTIEGSDTSESSNVASGENQSANTGESESSKKNTKPLSIAEVAEKLGLKVEDVFGLEIVMDGDGKKVTLGQLKDHMKGLRQYEVDKLTFEESKASFDRDAMKTKNELLSIVTKLKGVIPQGHFDAIVNAGREEMATKQHEQQKMLKTLIPEWNDKAVAMSDGKALNEYLEPYFGKGSRGFDSLNNAALIKFVRDSWKREQRVQKALAGMVEGNKRPTPASKKNSPPKVETKKTGYVDPNRVLIDSLKNI